LLSHTSGIPEYTMQPGFFAKLLPLNLSDSELLQGVSGKPFDFEPGTSWRYSNTNYYLLGMIVAKAGGQPYAAFMQDEFFTPLGLAHTRHGSETAIIPRRAQGYSFNPDTGTHSNDASAQQCIDQIGRAAANIYQYRCGRNAKAVQGIQRRVRGWLIPAYRVRGFLAVEVCPMASMLCVHASDLMSGRSAFHPLRRSELKRLVGPFANQPTGSCHMPKR
jgi:CubicO group peptidase (beta-lactamase class C family)